MPVGFFTHSIFHLVRQDLAGHMLEPIGKAVCMAPSLIGRSDISPSLNATNAVALLGEALAVVAAPGHT